LGLFRRNDKSSEAYENIIEGITPYFQGILIKVEVDLNTFEDKG